MWLVRLSGKHTRRWSSVCGMCNEEGPWDQQQWKGPGVGGGKQEAAEGEVDLHTILMISLADPTGSHEDKTSCSWAEMAGLFCPTPSVIGWGHSQKRMTPARQLSARRNGSPSFYIALTHFCILSKTLKKLLELRMELRIDIKVQRNPLIWGIIKTVVSFFRHCLTLSAPGLSFKLVDPHWLPLWPPAKAERRQKGPGSPSSLLPLGPGPGA